jgi:large subunit ribosomal protein L7/L12
MMSGGPVAAVAEDEEEETAPTQVQTSFTVNLLAFDPAKKVPLIKELKNQLEGMNLVQAKKFVESAPAIVKTDLSKNEAEDLQKALMAVGAECKID